MMIGDEGYSFISICTNKEIHAHVLSILFYYHLIGGYALCSSHGITLNSRLVKLEATAYSWDHSGIKYRPYCNSRLYSQRSCCRFGRLIPILSDYKWTSSNGSRITI
jgi:hypothetical protein